MSLIGRPLVVSQKNLDTKIILVIDRLKLHTVDLLQSLHLGIPDLITGFSSALRGAENA